MDQGPKVIPKTIQFLRGKKQQKKSISLCDLGLDNDFYDMTPKPQETKENKDKFNFIKTKNFRDLKDIIKKVKMGKNIYKSYI